MNNLKSFSVFSSLTENNDIGSDLDDLNSVQPHEVRRYYENFDYNSTAKTPEYKLYLKMSSKNR